MTAEQAKISEAIYDERDYQDRKWGGPEHDDLNGPLAWSNLIHNYLALAIMGKTKKTSRSNMIKVAALAVATIESIDRM